MKPDIHPAYVETQVTCTCGNTFTTRSTAPNGVMHADVCSACHPFYTGKQKILDTGGRVARFEKRYAAKQAGQEEVARPTPGGRVSPASRRFRLSGAGRVREGGERSVRVGSSRCATSSPTLEAALSDPAVHADLARARKVGRRYAELTPIVRGMDEYERMAGDLRAARELAEDDETFAAEAEELDGPARPVITERLTRLLAPRDPNDSSDALVEIKSGEGGEESALFAGDLLKMYTRYAESRGWKVEVLDAQETDLGGYKSVTIAVKAPSVGEPDQMPYGGAQVRGRRAPGAAGAGDRVPGPGAHLGRRRAGDARGGGDRGGDRRERSADRRLPLVGSRAGRASTPPTPRSGSPTCPAASWSPARTSAPSCRTGSRRCGCCAPG